MLPAMEILNVKLAATQSLPNNMAKTFKKMSMKVSVPKPSLHFSLLTILAGPDLRNLAIPIEVVNVERNNVQMKRCPSVISPVE